MVFRCVRLLLLIVFCVSCNKTPKVIPPNIYYQSEVMFETKPWQLPYNLPLSFGQSFYANYETNIRGEMSLPLLADEPWSQAGRPTTGYFYVLNSGEIVFQDRKLGRIYVFNSLGEYLIKIDLNYGNYVSTGKMWVGPHDEIYILYKDKNSPETTFDLGVRETYFLKRFAKRGNDWKLDHNFNVPLNGISDLFIRIMPNGHLFIKTIGSRDSDRAIKMYSSTGRYNGLTNAYGKTNQGILFEIGWIPKSPKNIIFIVNTTNDKILFYDEVENLDFAYGLFNFKCTTNGLIILYAHARTEIVYGNSIHTYCNIPYVAIDDPQTGFFYNLDLKKNTRPDYKYFNVADVSINYKGDIYAMYVYFNKPGMITGDEKIVLYRWRRN
jgi:hypothetical protein